MASYAPSLSFIFFFCFIFLSFIISDAIVPANETFLYVNQGDLNSGNEYLDYDSEYSPTYRILPPYIFPFRLCFYNTTPNAYTLALRMGRIGSATVMPWVWEANRGKPVRENATLSLGTDGNLILADSDGRVVWQTNTANKGVVGLAILSDGNVVLRDSKGNFVWQSFDSPTDTLLIGQSLRVNGGPYKLVSRESVTNNVDGVYSLVVEPKRLALYYKNNMRYWSPSFSELSRRNVMLANVTFRIAETEYVETYFHQLQCGLVNARLVFEQIDYLVLGRIQYNSSLSYLRLGIDGNIRVYTYRREVRTQQWTLLYTLFDKRENENGMIYEDECQEPYRCGEFGLCEDSQCVGCPTPNGVFAWSKDCDSKPPGCKAGGFTYYQLKGVDHFTVKYTTGNRSSRSDCESKCTKDCNCMGYFYHTDNSRCWIAQELRTLTRVGNSTHLAYIKTPVH